MRFGMITGITACLLANALAAQSTIQVSRAVYVERADASAGANAVRAIEPATQLHRGDRVILLVESVLPENGRSFTISSTVPARLAFEKSSRDSYEVSIDGGRSWGVLGQYWTGRGQDRRLVSPEDVTHLRWRFASRRVVTRPVRITYSARVR